VGELVNFFVIGVQKGGTRALSRYLRCHAGLQMSRAMEVHYFDNEDINWEIPSREHLHAQFDWSSLGMIRGEVTPIYLYWPNALRRLQQYNPNAKIIVLLRHPVHRAFSHWRMETARGLDNISFEEAIQSGRERVRTSPNGAHRVFSYVERGFYSEQIARLFALFPRNQVHFLRTDELWRDANIALDGISRFIGSEPFGPLCHVHEIGKYTAKLSEEAKAHLMELYEHQIKETSRLTGLELHDWLSDGYKEPMHP
jgi:sulfotransferase family protein